ncbi:MULTISPECIES: hypothetical protein [unclassified Paenibacillus]|uniref:hypothetical protein n=1 Tax=unclassified Paenibacillus TaxID=185978 RepID=UPI00020D7280|nr:MULTISPECIES: hypothetical protein [unclassified Paenibacillus]EGL17517.1 hypothetical protein HMPREF9413_5384 [Paenibacillus sp. HGF7]EPD81288.1 hypothetical protein HMPREF1207_05045 [Paenibacillus sp. HGH0039]
MDVIQFMKSVDKELRNIVKEGKPAKCHTYCNLIASYLNVHFDEKIKHVRVLGHGWVSSDDFVLDYVQPFEGEQTIGDNKSELYLFHKYMESEGNAENYDLLALEEVTSVKNPYFPGSFIEYIKSNFSKIDDRVVDMGYYK